MTTSPGQPAGPGKPDETDGPAEPLERTGPAGAVGGPGPTAAQVEADVVRFLQARTKLTQIRPEADLFADGTISSMFAMELVVHLESTYDIAIVGPDLKMDHFRTVRRMAALVLRLQPDSIVSSGV